MAWGNPGPGSGSVVDTWVERLERNDATFCSLHILSFRRLSAADFVRLFTAIANNATLKELGCSGHTLEPEVVDALVAMLVQNHTLRVLKIGHAEQFGQAPEAFHRVAQALYANAGLRELDLEFKTLGMSNASALRYLLARPLGWDVLNLSRNQLNDACLDAIFTQLPLTPNDISTASTNAASDAPTLPGLGILDLGDNAISAQGVSLLCRWLGGQLPGVLPPAVRVLKLSYNPLRAEGIDTLCRLFDHAHTVLEELWLSDTIITQEGVPVPEPDDSPTPGFHTDNSTDSGRTAPSQEQAIQTIMQNISTQAQQGSTGSSVSAFPPSHAALWYDIGRSLNKSRTLTLLNLDRCLLKDSGMGGLLQGLAGSLQLKTLSLRDNGLSDISAHMLSRLLTADPTDARLPLCQLDRLDLSENHITPAGFADLLQCPQLHELVLYANRVHLGGPMSGLGNGDSADHLHRLDLSCNDITPAGFQWFCDALGAGLLHALKTLEVAGNASHDEMDAWDTVVQALHTKRPDVHVFWKRDANAIPPTPQQS
ncbi:hypothetical protein H4R34_004918 [Dimargaris verticillata]|uniref:RNI-like protein n=1 Tax=Dimargaris verticillata TaxID=2761393 RepID=A0A9W8EBR0_9FUNG|nr:hypothetical protein H4R34_004918 [Dimargaris verticillata]